MYDLLRFILRYGAVLLFILFELLAFYLVINYNQGQREIFLFSANQFTGKLYDKYDEAASYLSLTAVADSLARENARLREMLFVMRREEGHTTLDSTSFFEHIPARVISNSVTFRNNMIMLDRGTKDGVVNGLGVTGPTGPVGVVRYAGENYAAVLSILHSQSMISAKIGGSNHFGSLVWEHSNPGLMELQAVPKHANIQRGDSVVTSGYSFIFPEGLPIGSIEEISVAPGSNFYDISVRLFYDMSNLNRAYVLKHSMKTELDSLATLINEQK